MPRRAFRVAYDGRPYHGFQRQPDVTTVEGELLEALDRLDDADAAIATDDDGVPEGYAAAGRTDAGVSARAQTVAFDAPEWFTPYVWNGELPGSIRVWAHADARPGFHATHDANWRAYRYYLLAPDGDVARAVECSETANGASGSAASRARDALDRLCGEHDFHNLTPDDRDTVRELSGKIEREGVPASETSGSSSGERSEADDEFLVVTVRADGFARELVRRVVSLVQEVAAGASFDRIDTVLGAEPVDGPAGVPPANPHPLVLHDVDYDLEFAMDADAAADARERFADLRDDRRALARVADHLTGI